MSDIDLEAVRRPENTEISTEVECYHSKSSFVSEQFRSLKVSLFADTKQRSPRVITISSPADGDGKSLVAANLAACFVHDPGRNVVLIDCDLRNPRLHRLFGVEKEPGLVDYLEEETDTLEELLWNVDGLYLLPAGRSTAKTTEVLGHRRFGELIRRCRRQFDTVLLDSPPLDPVPDARVVARAGDGILLVIRRGKTPFRSVERAFRYIPVESVLGVVFNEVHPLAFHTQYDQSLYENYSAVQHDSSSQSESMRKPA